MLESKHLMGVKYELMSLKCDELLKMGLEG